MRFIGHSAGLHKFAGAHTLRPSGGSIAVIVGLGIDMVEVERIHSSWQKFGERFLNRILLRPEIEYCLSHKNPAPHIAARFAAKEAVSKAFGTGIGSHLGWHDVEVFRKPSGEPTIVLHEKALVLMQERGGCAIFLSLTHTGAHAAAVAVIDGRD